MIQNFGKNYVVFAMLKDKFKTRKLVIQKRKKY